MTCVCLCVSVCEYVHVSAHVLKVHKRELDPLELELQTAVSCLTCVLETELQSAVRGALTALDC